MRSNADLEIVLGSLGGLVIVVMVVAAFMLKLRPKADQSPTIYINDNNYIDDGKFNDKA